MQKKKKIEDGFFLKRWVFEKKEEKSMAIERIALIDKICKLGLQSIPKIEHALEKNTLTQRIRYYENQNLNNENIFFDKNHLLSLAKDLDRLHSLNFIHGDIHPKNLVFEKDKLILLDFEPCLTYKINGATFFNITPPWISHADFKNKRITELTDKIGFYNTAYNLLVEKKKVNNIIRMLNQRKKSDFEIWGFISDKAVQNKTCAEILNSLL